MGLGFRLRARMVLVAVLAAAGLTAMPAVANAAASWQEGPLVESQNIDCITGDVEQEAGAYLSYFADPTNPPQVGQVYYIAVDLSGIGDPCPGIYAAVNLIMPPGTTPAISAQNPVKCFMNLGSNWGSVAQYCPQSLPFGPYGYEVDPVNTNPPFWPLAAGTFVEIRIPVVSTQPLDGSSQLKGYIQLADGQDNPVLTPGLSIIVDKAAAQTGGTGTGSNQIAVYYSKPSITGQQDVSVAQGANTFSVESVSYTAWVQNNSNTGFAYPQVALPDSTGSCTNPTNIQINPTAPTSNTFSTPRASLQIPNTQLTGTLDLYRDVAYCWRIVAHVETGPQGGDYYGNWEFFIAKGSYVQYPQEPPPATPPAATTGCSTNGGGCATSNCTTQCTTALSPGQTLTVSLAGGGGGSVTDGKFINCPSTCSATYVNGAKVTLSPKPAAGSTFAGWGGACSGTGTCTVAMSAARSVTANFNAGSGGAGGGGGGGGTVNSQSSGTVLALLSVVHNQSLRSVIHHGLGLQLSCVLACQATIRLYLDPGTAHRLHLAGAARARRSKHSKQPVLIGSARVALPAGATRTVTVRLLAGAARALARLKSVQLSGSVVVSAGGTSTTRSLSIHLHR